MRHGVLIIGHPNLPATLPADASTLYARNVFALLQTVAPKAELNLNLEDELIRGTLLTHEKQVLHAPTAEALERA